MDLFFTYAVVSIIRSKGRRFGPVTRIRRNPLPNETMNSFDKQEKIEKKKNATISVSLSLSHACLRVLRNKGVEEGRKEGGGGANTKKQSHRRHSFTNR